MLAKLPHLLYGSVPLSPLTCPTACLGTSYFPTLTLPPPSSARGFVISIGCLCSLSSGRPELDHLSLRQCAREHGFSLKFRGTGREREEAASGPLSLSGYAYPY